MVGTPRWVLLAIVAGCTLSSPSNTHAFNGRLLSSFGFQPTPSVGSYGSSSAIPSYGYYGTYGGFGSGSIAYCPTVPSFTNYPYSYSTSPVVGSGLTYTYGVYEECSPRAVSNIIGAPVAISPEPPIQYASPAPAPPSRSNEPPLLTEVPAPPPPPAVTKEPAKKGVGWKRSPPIITETRSMGSMYASLPGERARVGFWNLTDREVTLHVEGQSMKLTKDQSVTLDLPRMFAWRVDERLPQTERVVENQAAHEVLIRP